jgi:hypothetical protein
VPWHGNESSWKPRAYNKYLYFTSVVKSSSDATLLVFHVQTNLFAFNVTFRLNEFISIKVKINNFYGLKWHLSIPPVQDIPLPSKIPKYNLRAFALNF